MSYSLFLLPPFLPESSGAYKYDTTSNVLSGYYSFGTDGLNVKLQGNLGNWNSSIFVRDVGGVSGEVKRLEELQEFKAMMLRGNIGIFGGILTEDFTKGRFRGEGLVVFHGDDTLKFLLTMSDIKRVRFRLIKGYNGPYVLPEKFLQGSVRVYLNGRILKEGYEIRNGAIYLRKFEDGDILTVEYQDLSGERIALSEGVIRKNGMFVRGFSKVSWKGESFRGCIRGKGDYRFSNDTFYIDVKGGDLVCNFVRVENGDYLFLGDKFVFVGSGGNYTIKPLENAKDESVISCGYSSGTGSVEIFANSEKALGSSWEFKLGRSIYILTFGNYGYVPKVPLTKTTGLDKNLNLGLGLNLEGFFGELIVGSSDGTRSASGKFKLGEERGLVGEFFNYEVWETYKFGGFISNFYLFGNLSKDTFGRSYGFSTTLGSFSSDLKRYEDGFLSYFIELDGENLRLNYGRNKLGRSINLELILSILRLSLISSVSLKKDERFVYVGKGWGDYERDSLGNFYPKPFGSYKREILYSPTDTPVYDFNLSLLENVNLSLRTNVRSVKGINLSVWYYRDSMGLSLEIFKDNEIEGSSFGRILRGYLYNRWFLEGESFYRISGREIFYNLSSFGYAFFGLEILKGVSWAISPLFRVKTPFYISAYYRFYMKDPGNEALLKPPGPSLNGTLSISRVLENLRITLYINCEYSRNGGFSWNFGLNLFGSF